MEGFTIRNGVGLTGAPFPENSGGGILVHNGTQNIQLNNLLIEQCNGQTSGVGLFLHYGSATLTNSILKDNLNGGIHLHAAGAYLTMNNVKVIDNLNAESIFIYDTGIEIYNSEISNNDYGGIVYSGVGFSPNIFENVLFQNNGTARSFSNFGGAINFSIRGADVAINNCTFYNNLGSSDIRTDGGFFNNNYAGNWQKVIIIQ